MSCGGLKCAPETVYVDAGGRFVNETRLDPRAWRLGSPIAFLTDSQRVDAISPIMIIMLSRRMHPCVSGTWHVWGCTHAGQNSPYVAT